MRTSVTSPAVRVLSILAIALFVLGLPCRAGGPGRGRR